MIAIVLVLIGLSQRHFNNILVEANLCYFYLVVSIEIVNYNITYHFPTCGM